MVHRAQDSRLLTQLLKSDKEYSYALNGLLTTSQGSLAALNAYASSCPPAHAQPLLGVVSALSAAEDAFKAYVMAVDAWRADLKRVRRAEEVVANVLRDREILIGKLIKVSNKKSTRDSVGIATPFANDPTLALNPAAINGSASSVTLTSGNAKLNHAQAELQACEAHLALKEKELENTREEAIKRGLERRCKALVTCGWAWGERGKQALRALDSLTNEHSTEHDKSTRSEQNDSQLSSVTPSQSASQIAGIVTSDESPARSSMSKPVPSTSSPLHARQHSVAIPEPEPEFKLSIRPAHSIDDHDHIHDSIPSSKQVGPSRRKSRRDGDSSDEDLSKGVIQVHENDPFGKRTSGGFRSEHTPSKLSNVAHSRTLRRPDARKYDSPKIGFPLIDSEGTQRKSKHSSDLGPRTNFPSSSPQEEKFNTPTLHRKRSTSFSLIGGLSGLFKGKKRSSSAERSYPLPTTTGGWHTRTDKNLVSSRRGRTSSSEEELPSTLIRKAKQTEQAPVNDNSSINSESRKLTKRMSTGASRFRRPSIRDNEAPSKYTIVEQPVNASLVRNESFSSKKSDKVSTESSREMARETAANTAMNAGNSVSRRSSMPPERTNSETRGRTESTSNRHQSVDGARSLEGPRSELAKLSERLKKLEEVESELKKIQTSPMPVLSADKLEVVKAPPSIIQTPLLFHATPATSFGSEPATSPRVSTLKSAASPPGSPARTPNRLSSSGLPTSPTGGANLKARSSVSSRDSVPLKSALKSPKQTSTPLPALPSILKHDSPAPSPGIPDHFTITNRDITSTPPTPLGAKDGLKPNGDSLFVPRSNAIVSPSPRSPPTTSSLLVPTPRPLSEIPSARSSMMGDENESEYETADDMEDDSDGTHTPHPPSPPHEASSSTEKRDSRTDDSTLEASSRTSPNLPDRQDANDVQRDSSISHESQNPEASASNSTTSNSTQGRRKSVRMLIYPTVAVAPPEQYDDETTTPSRSDQSPPLTPASSSTIRAASSATAGPSTWETRINTNHNVWDDSSEEDEEYRRAKRALSRATEPSGEERKSRIRRV